MPRRITLVVIIVLAFAGSYLGKKLLVTSTQNAPTRSAVAYSQVPARSDYSRIVSLAPSITETLFALDLGSRVVGVTRYCDYPPEALAKAKVGGYCDPNYEAIVTLKPDLVMMLPEHERARDYLTGLGTNVLVLNHKTISGILNSIMAVGKACSVEDRAEETVAEIEDRMAGIIRRTKGLARPRVLLSVGRNMGSGSVKDLYISGRNNIYDEMITIAGGVNAYEGQSMKFPVVSAEGILRINPQVIIDMVPDLADRGLNEEDILREWQSVARVDAVKDGRVCVLGQDYVVVPGPRFILALESMARAIHPEINWERP